MLSRFLPKSSHIRLLSNLYSKSPSIFIPPRIHHSNFLLRPFSNGNGWNPDDEQSAATLWNLSGEADDPFAKDAVSGVSDTQQEDSWAVQEDVEEGRRVFKEPERKYEARGDKRVMDEGSWADKEDIEEGCRVFDEADRKYEARGAGGDNESVKWEDNEEEKPWSFEEGDDKDQVFDIGDVAAATNWGDSRVTEEQRMLQIEENQLKAIIKGPNRAFGDLIAASGITDDMIDSLIALKEFEGIDGLPPLSQIEDMRYEKNTRKSARADIERQKQEEVAKARVRQVDEKGRAYGTGRRKCSIARVWIQPGEGKFVVNDKQFDVYFPMLDHRAALLRPFSETKTLGLWDIDCTVKGGGVSGQVGAIQLGISRALQNWEPDLRPPLKNCGFLTRDPRVVERKKPGKAKARKSFQWVKR
ncbi:30S ribosomal protein S9 mitochondrial [Euphorbia peplus]|nr:30S ribosomal protein S9 mitochondrial [Euphorbia peplus]